MPGVGCFYGLEEGVKLFSIGPELELAHHGRELDHTFPAGAFPGGLELLLLVYGNIEIEIPLCFQ